MARPKVQITHCQEFSAAHRLNNSKFSEAENKALYGPCNNAHGHNYRVEVTVTGSVDPETGMVMNLNDLREIMHEEIWQHVDHKHLNEDVPFLKGMVPTAENLAVIFWQLIQAQKSRFGGAKLHKVRVVESRDNFVEYFGAFE